MIKIVICICVFYFISISSHAQEPLCANWPAECPDNNSIENSQSISVRLGNGLLKSEIDEQDKFRQFITGIMQQQAAILHWPMVELEEITGLAGFQKSETPVALRSPRGIGFYFQFVADEDSLQSWKDWKNKDIERRNAVGNNAGQSYGDVINSPQFKNYMDSSNHYRDLYIAYLEKHKNDGAAVLNDKTAEQYAKKMNQFSDKAVAMQTQNIEHNGWKELENQGKQITHRFRNASIVYVHIEVNDYNGEVNDEVNTCSDYPASGARIARRAVIREPENDYYHEFGKWDNMIVLLLGNWLNKKTNGSYQAGFTENGQGDDRTPKKITSDKIQNLSVYVMGNRADIEKFVKQLDLSKLNGMIYRN